MVRKSPLGESVSSGKHQIRGNPWGRRGGSAGWGAAVPRCFPQQCNHTSSLDKYKVQKGWLGFSCRTEAASLSLETPMGIAWVTSGKFKTIMISFSDWAPGWGENSGDAELFLKH